MLNLSLQSMYKHFKPARRVGSDGSMSASDSAGPGFNPRQIVMLIAIRPSDGDVKPGGPLGAFRQEQAMSRHRVSPSPFLSSSSSHTTQLHCTNSYTYSHPNLNFLQYTIQILVPHVMWSA